MNKLQLAGILTLAMLTANAVAQPLAGIDAALVRRLGLVFQRVEQADPTAGMEVPATVISSPYSATTMPALFAGVFGSWRTEPGMAVEAGVLLGTMRSPQLLEIQQQWLSAKAEEEQAMAMLERDRSLQEQGIIAASRLQVTELGWRNARVKQQGLAASLASAGYTGQDLQALQQDTSLLGIYQLRAPSSGIVSHLHVHSGENVDSGEVLLSLTSPVLWVSAELPSMLAGGISVGQRLALTGNQGELVVRMKEQELDRQAQTQGIMAEFTMAVALQPGQIVRLLIPAAGSGVLIPDEAVVHNGEETAVYVRTAAGIEQRTLELQALGSNYLAQEGISAGESVVIRGAALLKGITLGLGGE